LPITSPVTDVQPKGCPLIDPDMIINFNSLNAEIRYLCVIIST
jgi:hypothetical protein